MWQKPLLPHCFLSEDQTSVSAQAAVTQKLSVTTFCSNHVLTYLLPLLTKMTVSENSRSDADLCCLVIKTERDIVIWTLKPMSLKKIKSSNLKKNQIFKEIT